MAQLARIATEHGGELLAVAVAQDLGRAAFEELVHVGGIAAEGPCGLAHGEVVPAEPVSDFLSYRVALHRGSSRVCHVV